MEQRISGKDIYAFIAVAAWTLSTTAYSMLLSAQGSDIRSVDPADTLLIIAIALTLFIQPKAGFPAPLDPAIPSRNRFGLPFLIGVVFGVLDIIAIRFIQHPEPYSSLPPFLQPFPYSVFLYTHGAIYTEVFYRLLPFMVIMLPITRFAPRSWHEPVFWTVAVITSLIEPLMQFPEGPLWMKLYASISGFAMNFAQAWFFRKSGFFGSLSVRLGHYAIWHILQGIYVELFELN